MIFLFAFGACVGSFLNVVIWRMPRGESIVFPGSRCPACGRGIHWYDNIPLLSWVVLKGRCRACKAPISPRYLVVEAVTAVLVCGLYVAMFVFPMREGAGRFQDGWPAYLAHASLFCGLLASSLVDIENWIIPLEVCWFVSAVGVLCATIWPPAAELLPRVAPATGATALGAAVGLVVALVLTHYGFIQRSFLDADEKAQRIALKAEADRRRQQEEAEARKAREPKRGKRGKRKRPAREAGKGSAKPQPQPQPPSVGVTRAHGVNPRVEILRELVFLAPAVVLAVAAWALVTKVPAAREMWAHVTNPAGTRLAAHLNALLAAVFGYLIGGLWIWAFRIGGTLVFGREAMGLGDVHILAAVGAVCGWIVPSMAFFLAALLALAWAITVFTLRKQRELPYGPWLAAGALVTVVLYDFLRAVARPYTEALELLTNHYAGH